MASADLGDQAGAREFSTRAAPIRQRIVASMSSATPPAATPPAASIYRVGGGVTQPTVGFRPDPSYSDIARLLKYSGTVIVSIVVGSDGTPYNIRLVRGLGLGLDEKAAEAVSQWKFRPGTKGDTPVNVRAQIEVNFRLL
jgi:TonB family protein